MGRQCWVARRLIEATEKARYQAIEGFRELRFVPFL